MAAAAARRVLSTNTVSVSAQKLLDSFSNHVVGQEEATMALLNVYERYMAGLCDPTRPIGNALFLGPTGTGKTHVVETFAYGLFGDVRACIKIDCAEFQHSHEIAKLVGSPPGYLGHRETHPVLTQEALDLWHNEKLKMTILLFDEIEKASDALWNLMLGILDKATLTLGDNRKVDFSKCILVMTSNLGGTAMNKAVDGGLGFATPYEVALETSKLKSIAISAAKSKFTPEFMNRIQHTSVFQTLTEEQIRQILDIELVELQRRMFFAQVGLKIAVSPKARRRLATEGFDKAYGARHLKRAIDRLLEIPLARIITSQQVGKGDTVIVDEVGKEEFEFSIPPFREER